MGSHFLIFHPMMASLVSMSASRVVGRGLVHLPCHTKDYHSNGTNCLLAWHTCIRVVVGTAVRLCKRPGSVWNCLWGHVLNRSLRINSKSRVLYPGPSFLSSGSSAIWSLMPKKHYNRLIVIYNKIVKIKVLPLFFME